MLKCGICGKEFELTDSEAYLKHMEECVKIQLKKSEDLKKINEELEELKRMRACYYAMRDNFKEKHPMIYARNFKDETTSNEVRKVSMEETKDSADIAVEYINRLFGLGGE